MAKILGTVQYPRGGTLDVVLVRKVALPESPTRTCNVGIVVRDAMSGANEHTVPASWVTRR